MRPAARELQSLNVLHEQRVAAAGERSATKTCSAGSRSGSGPLPLSVSQTRLWYLSQLAPDSPVYNKVITIRKTGPLDVEALRWALTEMVTRHEVWRTTFRTVGGVPYQFVREPAQVDLPITDLTDLDPKRAVHRANQIAAADTLRPYDLAEGPLIRPRLIRTTENHHRLYLGLHHLVFDETTLREVMFPELTGLYHSYVKGAVPSPPGPLLQYVDYTMWELDWVRGAEVSSRIANWRKRLAGSTPSQLPHDHPRPPRQTFAGGTISLTIERATVEGLRHAAQTAGGTLFDALVAAYAWWLHRYGDSTEVVFGSAHDLRGCGNLPAVAAGHCTTPMVLRCDVSGEVSFTALICRIRHVVREAVGDVVPFDTLVDRLGVPRDPRNNPLFQTALRFQSPVISAANDWSLHLTEPDVRDAVGSTTLDISIDLDEQPEGHIAGAFAFSTDLFDRETAREMASHWRNLLDALAAAPKAPMADHDLVTPEERRHQLSWNPTTQHGISSECAHEVISAQAERTPDAVAVQVADTTLTYRQLDERATAIASLLVSVGAGPGTVVAVLMDRTPDLVAAILGILKSGAAFLPLDPRQSAPRNAFCINDVGAKIVLTDGPLPTGGDPITAAVVDLGDPGPRPARRAALPNAMSPDALAYVICTSGSTGRPKPVLIEHRGLTNLIHTMFREFGVTASDTVLSVASVTFDMAVCDIFCTLACGARLILATAEQATNPAVLDRLMTNAGVTYMMATPTLWSALIAAGWKGDPDLTAVPGGEALTDALADALLQRCGAVWNAYGPTETTVVSNVARLAHGDCVTVGRPLPNVRVYVTDARGRLQPVGVPGEIAIGGVTVGRGYLNRPKEHARRFGDDPFHPGGRLYRTGDRGRFLPDGRLQHLGRYDDQVKIRGFRIEPGEIESALCEHPDVTRCAVIAREAPNGEKRLVAYLVGESGCPSDAEARDWLRRRLPEYMVPSVFIHVSTLPTTSSGKLDRDALPAPPSRGAGRLVEQPPRNETERRIAVLWADLLATPVNDVNSDFFDVGGHSLLAARLISGVQRAFGVSLSLSAFVDHGRTVAELAELIGAESRSTTIEVACGPPLHFVFSDVASAMSLRHLKAQWGAAQPVHALVPEQPNGLFDRSVTIEEHASRALSAIRNRQPDGPLAVVGYSIGGLLAYEIARQAVDAGQEVQWLGVVDVLAPSMAELLRAQLTLRWRLRRIRRQPARERWAKYVEVGTRLLRNGLNGLQPQDDFDYAGATEVSARYHPPPHGLPMHLFVSDASAADAEAHSLGWDEYHSGPLTVHRLVGDHVGLLDLPDVEQFARMMIDSLREASASTRMERATVSRNRERGSA